MAKIIYIAGYGRSGSTLLELALGHHKKVASMAKWLNAFLHLRNQSLNAAVARRLMIARFGVPSKRKLSRTSAISEIGTNCTGSLVRTKVLKGDQRTDKSIKTSGPLF